MLLALGKFLGIIPNWRFTTMRNDSQILTYTHEDTSLRGDQFALILMDKQASYLMFPCNNRENTINSCEEFERFYEELAAEEQKTAAHFLKESCLTWGLQPSSLMLELGQEDQETNQVRNSAFDSPVQKAASHQWFALRGSYPIDTKNLVKQAMEYFDQHRKEFDPRDARDFARNVEQRARDLDVQTEGTSIGKFASDEYGDQLGIQFTARKMLAKEAHIQDRYDKLLEYRNALTVDQFVDILTELDKKAGMDRQWGRILNHPYEATLAEKKASIAFTVDIDNDTYDSLQVKQALKNPDLDSLYGSGMISQLRSDPALILSLPKPDQKVILGHAED
jgi:hypothetical protein